MAIGFFAKLLAEDIEDMDASQAAVRDRRGGSNGSTTVSSRKSCRASSASLYRLDINLGIGGCRYCRRWRDGATLNTAFGRYDRFGRRHSRHHRDRGGILVRLSGGWCSNGPREKRREDGAADVEAAMGGVAAVALRGHLRLLLPADLRENDLDVRHGCTGASRGSRLSDVSTGMGL